MDFSALIPEGDTIEVTFEHKGETLKKENGDPCTWTLFAPHSAEFKEVTYAKVAENINESRKNKDKDEDTKEITVEEIKDLTNKRYTEILDVTKTFDLEMGGKPVKFSRKKAEELLQMSPKILSTLEDALSNSEDFT